MTPIADWYLNQIATYGVITVLAAQGVALAAIWGGTWTAIDAIEKRQRARRLELHFNHPGVRAHHLDQRKEDRP